MQIFVKALTGKTMTLDGRASDSTDKTTMKNKFGEQSTRSARLIGGEVFLPEKA